MGAEGQFCRNQTYRFWLRYNFHVSRRFDRKQPEFARGRVLHGLLLCVLVALFALVAKVAWYQPASHPAASITKQKAYKADPVSDTAHTVLSAGVTPVVAVPALFALLAILLFEAATGDGEADVPGKARGAFRRGPWSRPPPAQ